MEPRGRSGPRKEPRSPTGTSTASGPQEGPHPAFSGLLSLQNLPEPIHPLCSKANARREGDLWGRGHCAQEAFPTHRVTTVTPHVKRVHIYANKLHTHRKRSEPPSGQDGSPNRAR